MTNRTMQAVGSLAFIVVSMILAGLSMEPTPEEKAAMKARADKQAAEIKERSEREASMNRAREELIKNVQDSLINGMNVRDISNKYGIAEAIVLNILNLNKKEEPKQDITEAVKAIMESDMLDSMKVQAIKALKGE